MDLEREMMVGCDNEGERDGDGMGGVGGRDERGEEIVLREMERCGRRRRWVWMQGDGRRDRWRALAGPLKMMGSDGGGRHEIWERDDGCAVGAGGS
ncbi:hypothetical protein MRB53_026532 [Persea americana]|uniref:Uncharacterized protein n=1 Tax=Persea americana TaxID=3435 RepID=A0ACC2LIE7_PERAE|nr:hypothetical protein MRB53_026532 [Persea americana]